jgi:hypothetical protein
MSFLLAMINYNIWLQWNQILTWWSTPQIKVTTLIILQYLEIQTPMYWRMIKVITLNINEWILQIKIWFFSLQLFITL